MIWDRLVHYMMQIFIAKGYIMRKKWKWILGIALLLIISIVGISQCNKKKAAAGLSSSKEDTYTVAYGDIISKIEITGEVQPQTVVAIKSRVSGKIVRFYADENDYVKAGQIIADIEPDYTQANTLFNTKAQLQRAEMRLNNAIKEEADKKSLLAKNFISQKDYDTAADELTSARIDHKQASDQYELIRDLDTTANYTHVYATASGTVIERKINAGEMVQSSINSFGEGTVVMKIADLSKMTVKAKINEVDIAKFKLGQEAKISLDALPYQEFHGKIIKIAPMAVSENNAKVFPVEISINATGDIVKPGMTANLSIVGESRLNVLVIPIRAVFSDENNNDIVYLASAPASAADSTKTQRPKTSESVKVKLGSNDLLQVEVQSGLKEGDKILIKEPTRGPNMNIMMD